MDGHKGKDADHLKNTFKLNLWKNSVLNVLLFQENLYHLY